MIGVLALQGGFHAHLDMLRRLDVPSREVRLPRDLIGLDGLILPGGESTTMLKLLKAFDLFEPLREFGLTGKPILGTCAGAILMCETVNFRNQESLGFIPASIDRNAYGSQQESFRADTSIPMWNLSAVPALYIRAPRFHSLSDDVKVISTHDGDITGVTWRNFTAVTYHPELGDDLAFHQAWLDQYVNQGALVS